LLRWIEHPEHGLLLAPVPSTDGRGEDATYAAIGGLHASKDAYESVRLLYVACTRARKSLTLSGHLDERAGQFSAPSNSLLQTAWESLAVETDSMLTSTVDESSDTPPPDTGMLRRLPAEWSPPSLAPPLERTARSLRSASGYEHEAFTTSYAPGEERRFVGTVVHVWLEKISRQGVKGWPVEKLATIESRVRNQLLNIGYPGRDVLKGSREVVECLKGALRGEKGQWLLREHEEAGSEVAIAGLVGRDLVEAVVDRTFIAEDGVRWVVDYKTSSPGRDESIDSFLQRETENYKKQIESYVNLFAAMEPHRTISGALYFPRIDTLHVIVETTT
jgi:ATP-dependent exoDNAse (exonuclease V) beta subunit